MFGLGALAALAAASVSYFVCVYTHNVVAMLLAMSAVLAATLFFSTRWLAAAMRGAGIATGRPAPGALPLAIAGAFAMLSAVVATGSAYAMTENRLLEFMLGPVLGVTIAVFFLPRMYALRARAQTYEVAGFRMLFFAQLSLPFLMGFTLYVKLTERHHYADASLLEASFFAMAAVMIPMFPISAYYLRQQYLRAAGPTQAGVAASA